jgi:uncharacterized membrane protein (UPF0127 family)
VLSQNSRLLGSALLLVVILGGILVAHDSQNHSKAVSACGFRNDKTLIVGANKIYAEVANTETARTKGLSGRQCISQNEGMLFVFGQSGSYSFWMKDMHFPIDMIWISSAHKAVVVEEDVLPSSYPRTQYVNPKNEPALYVLEMQAHASTRLNINPGTPIDF